MLSTCRITLDVRAVAAAVHRANLEHTDDVDENVIVARVSGIQSHVEHVLIRDVFRD